MAPVWAARELCTHSDAFLRGVQSEGASMSFLPAITVCCSTLCVSPHQHSSITAPSHTAPTTSNSSCPVTQCQIPSQGGRSTHALSTTSHSHLSQGFSTATGRGFAPSSGTGMQLLQGMWLFGFCLLHTHQLHLALVPTPHAAPATPPMVPL